MERFLDFARDITFVLIALETFVVLGLLIILSRQVLKLIRIIRSGIQPIMKDAREAAQTTKATAEFVGEHVVKPTSKIHGKVSGIRRAWQVLFSDLPPGGRTDSS